MSIARRDRGVGSGVVVAVFVVLLVALALVWALFTYGPLAGTTDDASLYSAPGGSTLSIAAPAGAWSDVGTGGNSDTTSGTTLNVGAPAGGWSDAGTGDYQ